MDTNESKEENAPESVPLLTDNTSGTLDVKRKRATRCRKIAVLISCTLQLVVCCGIGYGLSVMYAELVIVFDAKRADAAWIQSLNMGLSCTSGIAFTGIIKKFGTGKSIIVGSIISAVGLFASAFANGVAVIILCTGVISGLAMSVPYLAAYITTGWMFPDSASIFLICVTSGISIGQFIIPLLFELFITQYSWSGAFILSAGICLQCIPCGMIIDHSKEFLVTNDGSSTKSNVFCSTSLLKDAVIWGLLINFLLYAMTGNIEAWFIVDHMVSIGFTRESGSVLVSAVGIGSLVGRLIGGFLRITCRFSTVYHWMYLYLIIGALHGIIINLNTFSNLLVGCVIYGVAFSTSAAQVPAIMFEATGLERYPQGMALLNIMAGGGDMLGPLLGGFMKDYFGTYDVLFYIAAGGSLYISLSTVIISCAIRRKVNL